MQESHNLEMQYKLLGAYMSNKEIFANIEHLISQNLFTTIPLISCFKTIKSHHDKGLSIDPISLHTSLMKSGLTKKDASVITDISQYSYLQDDLVYSYVNKLFEDYAGRYISPILKSSVQQISQGDVLAPLAKVKDAINNIDLVVNNVSKEKSVYEVFDEAISRIQDLKTGAIKQAGFSFGLSELTRKTGGIMQGITVVAGGKGTGKTTLLITVIVENSIKKKIPVLFFSLEMKSIEIMTNIISRVKQLNSHNLRTGNVFDEDISSIKQMREDLSDNLVIDETGGITWQYFETKCRAHRKKHKIPLNETILVMLDYLQLMKNSPDEYRMSKEERIEHIMTELMRVCKNENIALVLLSQFSRDIDKRASDKEKYGKSLDFRPKMSDLKGSGAIEAAAITILLLYRPEYHGITEKDGKNLRGICEVNIAKALSLIHI
jgi:replicative DNA helicase